MTSQEKALGSKKILCGGHRLKNAPDKFVSYEDTFFLENVVYNELVRRGCRSLYGKTYKGEVDFVAIKNGKKCFIQVSYLMDPPQTIKRELEP